LKACGFEKIGTNALLSDNYGRLLVAPSFEPPVSKESRAALKANASDHDDESSGLELVVAFANPALAEEFYAELPDRHRETLRELTANQMKRSVEGRVKVSSDEQEKRSTDKEERRSSDKPGKRSSDQQVTLIPQSDWRTQSSAWVLQSMLSWMVLRNGYIGPDHSWLEACLGVSRALGASLDARRVNALWGLSAEEDLDHLARQIAAQTREGSLDLKAMSEETLGLIADFDANPRLVARLNLEIGLAQAAQAKDLYRLNGTQSDQDMDQTKEAHDEAVEKLTKAGEFFPKALYELANLHRYFYERDKAFAVSEEYLSERCLSPDEIAEVKQARAEGWESEERLNKWGERRLLPEKYDEAVTDLSSRQIVELYNQSRFAEAVDKAKVVMRTLEDSPIVGRWGKERVYAAVWQMRAKVLLDRHTHDISTSDYPALTTWNAFLRREEHESRHPIPQNWRAYLGDESHFLKRVAEEPAEDWLWYDIPDRMMRSEWGDGSYADAVRVISESLPKHPVLFRLGKWVWRVLRRTDDQVYATTEYCIARACYQPFDTDHPSLQPMRWADTWIHQALQDRFEEIVPADARPYVLPTMQFNGTEKSAPHGGDDSTTTAAKITLLNTLEVFRFFPTPDSRRAFLLADDQDNYLEKPDSPGISCWWWLRPAGAGLADIADVSHYGSVFLGNIYYAGVPAGGVRPALTLNLESGIL
jgi:hypothetical protein